MARVEISKTFSTKGKKALHNNANSSGFQDISKLLSTLKGLLETSQLIPVLIG
jgi:hypothetical protein